MEWGKLVGNLRSDIGRLKQLVVKGDTNVHPRMHGIADHNAVHLSRSPSLPLGSRVVRPNITDGQTAGRLVTQSTPVQNLSSVHAFYTPANSYQPSLVSQSSQITHLPNIMMTPSHSYSCVGFDPRTRSHSAVEPFSSVAAPQNGPLPTISNVSPEFSAPSQCVPQTWASLRRAQS